MNNNLFNPENINLMSWLITGFFCVYIYKKYRDNIKKQSGNKTEYTTLGMLGTFVGICLGIMFFDPEKINETLPTLLGGLKFAFITSVWGLWLSILHASKSQNWEFNEADDPSVGLLQKIAKNIQVLGADKEDSLLGQIKLLRVDFKDFIKETNTINKTNEILTTISKDIKVLGEDTDDTLLGQIKLLRSDFGDFAKEVAKASSETATKAIVEALTEVIKNFNAKITEQFGENFKHLNEGVGKLIEWQNNYKEYMESYKANLDILSTAIKENSKAVQDLPEIVSYIQKTIENTDKEIVKLSKDTGNLNEFSKELKQVLPKLISNIEDLTRASIEKTKELTDNLTKQLEKLTESASKSSEEVAEKLINSVQTISDKSLQQIENVQKDIIESLNNLDLQTKQTIPSVKQSLEDVVGSTDQQLEIIGRHIVSVVQKLVDDFEK